MLAVSIACRSTIAADNWGCRSAAWTCHLEDVVDRGVLLIAEPRQRFDEIEIDQSVFQYFVTNVHSEHLADDGAVDAVVERAG